MGYIQKLKNKPSYVRKRLAFVFSVVVVLIIAAFWIFLIFSGNTDHSYGTEGEKINRFNQFTSIFKDSSFSVDVVSDGLNSVKKNKEAGVE